MRHVVPWRSPADGNLADDWAAALAAATRCEDKLDFISDMLDLSSDKFDVNSCVLIFELDDCSWLLCLLLDEISLDDIEWCITCLITIQIRFGQQTAWALFNMSRWWRPWLDKLVRQKPTQPPERKITNALSTSSFVILNNSHQLHHLFKPLSHTSACRPGPSVCARPAPGQPIRSAHANTMVAGKVDAFCVGSLFQSTMSIVSPWKKEQKKKEKKEKRTSKNANTSAPSLTPQPLDGWSQLDVLSICLRWETKNKKRNKKQKTDPIQPKTKDVGWFISVSRKEYKETNLGKLLVAPWRNRHIHNALLYTENDPSQKKKKKKNEMKKKRFIYITEEN